MSAAALAFADGSVLRYHDARFQTPAAKLLPTQYLVVDDGTALVTVLGSCVAACIRDPLLKLGGMNHFLLPSLSRGSRMQAATQEPSTVTRAVPSSTTRYWVGNSLAAGVWKRASW